MKRNSGTLLVCGALLLLCTGCFSMHDAKRQQCEGLPDPAQQDCLRRRGESVPFPYYLPSTVNINNSRPGLPQLP